MTIRDAEQPKIITIDEKLRLIKPNKIDWQYALPWYRDKEVMYYSEGISDKVYDMDTIEKMYKYLSGVGELYFIEVLDGKHWVPIGDATLSEKCMPIVIGNGKYRGKGIGKKVMIELINRAKSIGISKIKLSGIYKYNERSKKLFTSLGFKKISEDEKSEYYEIILR